MRIIALLPVPAALALAAVASAEPPPAPTALATREVRIEVVVDGSLDAVWADFTTKEGLQSWAVPLAEVDFRVGGTIRTNYDAAAKPEGPGWIVHHVLTLDPKRMYSGRFEAPANAPPGARKAAGTTWTVTYFEPVGPARTKVTLAHLGFGTGPEWDEAHAFFQKGNAWSLEQLRLKRAKPAAGAPSSADAAAADERGWRALSEKEFTAVDDLAATSPGRSEWRFRVLQSPRALVVTRRRPQTVAARVEEAWFAWFDPARGAGRVVAFERIARTTEGTARFQEDGSLVLEWPVERSISGGLRRMRIGPFEDRDSFDVVVDEVRRDGAPTVPSTTRLTKQRPAK